MAADYIRYANQGATRNQPIDTRLAEAFGFLPELGLAMEVFSGGQPGIGSGLARVGSTRHDHGNAADVFFLKGDQRLDWANPEHVSIFQDIVGRAKARGVTGFGAGPGYMQPGSMHVGYGTPGVWGAGGKSANAPDWLRAAFDGTKLAPGATSSTNAPVSGSRLMAEAGPVAPGGPTPQQFFGDLVAPQAPASFANIIDSFAQRRQMAEAEHQAKQARLAALFADLPA